MMYYEMPHIGRLAHFNIKVKHLIDALLLLNYYAFSFIVFLFIVAEQFSFGSLSAFNLENAAVCRQFRCYYYFVFALLIIFRYCKKKMFVLLKTYWAYNKNLHTWENESAAA